ncbi:hypothetical protein [Synechococcus phage S-H25]|nr:hypothetical protein [Synechococcus phage S-H25]
MRLSEVFEDIQEHTDGYTSVHDNTSDCEHTGAILSQV